MTAVNLERRAVRECGKPKRQQVENDREGKMPRVNIGDKTKYLLRGILAERGMTGASVAKTMKKSVSTVNYQLDHAETMPISQLREYANLAKMTDEEIVLVIRG